MPNNQNQQLANSLLSQGLSIRQIALQLSVSRFTVKRWVDPDYAKAQNQRNRVRRQSQPVLSRIWDAKSRNKTRHETLTYFIQDGEFVKIGSTNNLPRRLRHLQAGNPHQLEVLGVTNLPEKQLHNEFASLRVSPNSEWFFLTPVMEVFIQENSQPLVLKGQSSEILADPK